MNFPFVPEGAKVHTVSELTRDVKTLIEDAFATGVWVEGEVSNLRKHSSGHWYLTLKDKDARLNTVIYRGINMRLKFDLRDGQTVIARGQMSVYMPHGEYQLQVAEVYPKGIGELDLALRQLREKLQLKGYFDPRRKTPLPRVPRRLALVTSPTGAAVRDVLEILTRRWPAVEVVVYPVRVQGDGAAQEIAAAVGHLNRLHAGGVLPVDVMIVGRGGGSLEDLWAFNEECVADAIFASRIPVVSAVGHETDVTIADLVADHRALTPTHAATDVVPDRQELLTGLLAWEARLHDGMTRRLEQARRRLDDLAGRRAFRLPLERVREQERRLDDWAERLQRAGRQRLARCRERLEATAARLESVSPLGVLARGYSLTQTEAGDVLRDAAAVRPGDRVRTRLHRGRIVARVEAMEFEPDPLDAARRQP
jgi:exodeoxyribonuclease VII large subunit